MPGFISPPGSTVAPVGRERLAQRGVEVLELGDPDAVLPRADAAERGGLLHQPVDRGLGPAEHRPVVRHDRDVHVHVPVPGVHVRRQHHEAGADVPHDPLDPGRDLRVAARQLAQRGEQALDRGAAAHLLGVLPGERLERLLAQVEGAGDLAAEPLRVLLRRRLLEEVAQPPGQLGQVLALLLEIHAVDPAGELREGLERQHDVLVELEGVRARRDRAEALAVGPEALRLRGVPGHRDLGVGVALEDGADLRDRALELGVVVPDDVDQQHGLRASRRARPSRGSRSPARTGRRSARAPPAPRPPRRGRRAPARGSPRSPRPCRRRRTPGRAWPRPRTAGAG